ncbi:MAG: nucleotidyltransferase domain-containing protein [Gammaproteobacteria bacterium]
MTTKQSRRQDPASVLFGASHRRLLGLLFMRPDESFHIREIARLAGADAGNVHRTLRRFEQAGLVKAKRSGNQRHYQANRESPIFAELQGIVRKTAGLADVLLDALEPLAPRIEQAFVFGSLARGEAGPRSDVDLMVVGTATFAEVVEAVYPLHQRLGREVNPIVLTAKELRARAKDPGFIARVVNGPRIMLFGVADDA